MAFDDSQIIALLNNTERAAGLSAYDLFMGLTLCFLSQGCSQE